MLFRSLGLPIADFYESLKIIPVAMKKSDLMHKYRHLQDSWERIFSTYGEPSQPLPLREVLLFGVAECDRAKRFPLLLERGDMALAGKFMYLSHDGDRVTLWENQHSSPYRSPFDDAYLDHLSDKSRSLPTPESSFLAWHPGGYRCSIPELDRIVDSCKTLDGVLGAGLTGAGLGGAILALVRSEASDRVIENLKQVIALWNRDEPWVERCHPVAGASVIEWLK